MPDLETQIAEVDELEQRARAEKAAALWLQGEQAYALWHESGGSSPIGRQISHERLVTATAAGADPVMLVVVWLDAVAKRARKKAGAYLKLDGEATPAEVFAAIEETLNAS